MPHHKTLDEYDFSYQPELDPRKVLDLATLAFVEAKANAALLGPPGVGKTHIAVALAVAACRAQYSATHHHRRHGPPAQGRRRHLPAASKLRTYLPRTSWSSTRWATCRRAAKKPTSSSR